jgi:hypothetical protein
MGDILERVIFPRIGTILLNHLNWQELIDPWNKYVSKKDKDFRSITLQSMSNPETVSMSESTISNIAKGVLKKMHSVMNERGISIDETLKDIYQIILNAAFSSLQQAVAIPAPPGLGKSTLLNVLLSHLLSEDIDNAGAIVVVERIETAIELANELGIFRTYMELGDVHGYYPKKAAYVMQSAYSYKKCKQDLSEYVHNICSKCEYKWKCPIPQKYIKQKKCPVVIMTQARIKQERDSLDRSIICET